MKLRHLLLSLTLMLVSLPAWANAQIGQKAPDFTLKSANGETVKLSDYAGKIVVLEWTNHECPYVKKHYETNNMQKTQEKATQNGAIWLSIVSSAPGRQGHTTEAEAMAIEKKVGAHATHRLLNPEGSVGKSYGAATTPHMFIIDTNGTLVYAGAIDSDPSARHDMVAEATNYVDAAIADLQAGHAVKMAETKPYGCSVKYGLF